MGRGFSSNANLLKTDLDFGGTSYHGVEDWCFSFTFSFFFLGKAQKSMRTLHESTEDREHRDNYLKKKSIRKL